MGLFSWLLVYSIGKRFNIYAINPRRAKTHYSGIISNLIFGLTASQAIVSLSPNLFAETVAVSPEERSFSRKWENEVEDFRSDQEDEAKNNAETDDPIFYMY